MISEHDIAAYRLMAEILLALRERLDKEMRALFGQLWLAEQAPEPLRRRLAERNEHEEAVSFSQGTRRELFDYADFGDIGEVLQGAGPGLLDGVFAQRQVLQSRLLELQVVQLKLSLALSLDEQEVALLNTLHGRLGLTQGSGPALRPSAPAPGHADPSRAGQTAAEPVAQGAPIEHHATTAPPVAGPAPAPEPATPVQVPATPVTQEVQPAHPRPAARIEAPTYEEFMQALDRGTSLVIIRSLYSEIMTAAESVWTTGAIPDLRVWRSVCESSWYQEKFVQLGLKPVSDFYAILDDVPKTLGSSPPKDKLAEHLSRRGFAQCLTALREVFQKQMK
jgi:hypothetical protein